MVSCVINPFTTSHSFTLLCTTFERLFLVVLREKDSKWCNDVVLQFFDDLRLLLFYLSYLSEGKDGQKNSLKHHVLCVFLIQFYFD